VAGPRTGHKSTECGLSSPINSIIGKQILTVLGDDIAHEEGLEGRGSVQCSVSDEHLSQGELRLGVTGHQDM